MKTVRSHIFTQYSAYYVHMDMLTGNNPVIATVLLPYLIPDPRSKPELEKILQLSYVSWLIHYRTK